MFSEGFLPYRESASLRYCNRRVAVLEGHGCGIRIRFRLRPNSAGLRYWFSLLMPQGCGINKTRMRKENTLRSLLPVAFPFDEFFGYQFLQPAINTVGGDSHLPSERFPVGIAMGAFPRLPQVQGEPGIKTLRAPIQTWIVHHPERNVDRVQAVRVELFRRAHVQPPPHGCALVFFTPESFWRMRFEPCEQIVRSVQGQVREHGVNISR